MIVSVSPSDISLDAYDLRLPVLRFNAPISLIHDSVVRRATDIGRITSIVNGELTLSLHLSRRNAQTRDVSHWMVPPNH